MHTSNVRRLHVAMSTVLLFSALFSPLLWVAIMAVCQHHQLIQAGFFVLAYGLAMYFVCSPTIKLSPHHLVHQTFFYRWDIDLQTITHVSVDTQPGLMLKLRRKGQPSIAFSIKAFSQEDIVVLLGHIQRESFATSFDQLSQRLGRGHFEPINQTAFARLTRLTS